MKRVFPLVLTVALLASLMLFLPSANTVNAGSPLNSLNKIQHRILSGFAEYELNPNNAASKAPAGTHFSKAGGPSSGMSYFPGPNGCGENLGNNVKTNQNCLNLADSNLQGRSQAENETAIAQDPMNPSHILAASNDYRRGDSTCGAYFSLNNGNGWVDSTMPNGFTHGTNFGSVAREYWQASGDPAVGWDTKGNAYYQCMTFMRGQPSTNNPDLSSAIYVLRSTQNDGASYNFTARPVVEFNDVGGSGCCLLDKPYMGIDDHVGSPFQDRVYVTWTFFAADGTARIYEAHSNDYGETFSSPVVVSTSSSLCPNGFSGPNQCDENQFSQPFTGSDGALYVIFSNFNNAVTPPDNRNQILLAKSTDGGSTFGALVKVSDYYDLPDCATYQNGQDPFRACVPEKGSATNSVFRATNYASGGVNPKNASQVVVTFGSYINVHSNESNGCVPNGIAGDGDNLYTGVKTAGACNNDILLSVSSDGGATFTGTSTDPRNLTSVNQDPGQATTDQWFQWAAFNKNGQLAVSYYDREYGSDETTGMMDVTLSGSKDNSSFGSKRVTSASMPLPTEFPDSIGNSLFFGDYAGLAAVDDAHPLWSDTRNVDLFLCPGTGTPGVPPAVCQATEPNGLTANDQESFTSHLGVPVK